MSKRIHPKPVSLAEIFIKFSTDEQCLQYIGKMRWPDGIVRCPTCGDKNISKYERPAEPTRKTRSKTRDEKKVNRRAWFYICLNKDCRQQFSPTSGTLFADSHLPLITWFHAIGLMLNAKKGISAKQLQRDLGIGGYKTAWYLNHRIREAMGNGDIPKLGGIVEIDETYVGGKVSGKGQRYAKKQKQVVMGAIQRGGELRLQHVTAANVGTFREFITSNVSDDVERVMTDQHGAYPTALGSKLADRHETVNHIIGEYVRGDVTTNSIESAFSLFKRGVIGQYHKLSAKHLQRYLTEFEYRFNRRNDADVFIETVRRLCGFKPLRFADLTSDPETASF
jgi:ISXO2-like transposase domain/Transposase zinc-ribbon domain